MPDVSSVQFQCTETGARRQPFTERVGVNVTADEGGTVSMCTVSSSSEEFPTVSAHDALSSLSPSASTGKPVDVFVQFWSSTPAPTSDQFQAIAKLKVLTQPAALGVGEIVGAATGPAPSTKVKTTLPSPLWFASVTELSLTDASTKLEPPPPPPPLPTEPR